MTGRLICIVGPSGVGKDTLIAALAEASPDFAIVRRVITRAPELGGEDFEGVTEEEFERRRAAGAFCIHWRAHGLSYGIPDEVRLRVGKGEQLLVNLSRGVLEEVAAKFPQFAVLNVTASAEVLAARLADRGRETPEEIEARLNRSSDLPEGLPIVTIENDGPIEETVDAALGLLHPVRA